MAEVAELTGRSAAARPEPDRARLAHRLSGPSGLSELHNTFARRHALAEIAGRFSAGATMQQLEATTDRYLTDASVVALCSPSAGEMRFTTVSLLASERAIVDSAERRRDARVGVIPATSCAQDDGASSRPVLNADQAAAVHALTTSGHGIDTVCALAGTGKTTMLAAVAERYRDAGYRVIGTAPTARAARELRDTAGTMHALIGELDRAGGFPKRTVLMIDEAGMASTRITAAIFIHAEHADTRSEHPCSCRGVFGLAAGTHRAAATSSPISDLSAPS